MIVEHAAQGFWKAMDSTLRFDAFTTLLVFVVVLLVVKSLQPRQKRSSGTNILLPPGPWGLPIVGYLPFMRGAMYLCYSRLAEKYGRMFSTWLGNQLIVVLSDYRDIRETFRREEFSARPHTEFGDILGGYGIINTEGSMWREQRKFLHDKLRSFGMTYMGSGKKVMESRIMNEVNQFLKVLLVQRGEPASVSSSLGTSISNVICSIIMGIRFHHDEPRFHRFMSLIEQGFKLFGVLHPANYVPALQYLPWLLTARNEISRNRTEMAEFFQQTIEQHRATFDENNIRDLIDAYLLEIQKAKAEDRDQFLYDGKDPDRQMQQILGDLFSAGMETVKTTLEWAVVLMMHNPEAAKAVQEELDNVVGRSRLPSLEDLPFLPITEATLLEVLRRSSIVPLGTTHATTRDVQLHGYTIPAGSQVVPLLHAVHMNPDLWDEPKQFRPSRFLTAEGKVHKPEYFMPFGVGRRKCLGEVLARMELFLFFTSMLHTFDFRPTDDGLPSLQGNVGITMTLSPFKVRMVPRKPDLINCNTIETTGPLRNVGSH